MLDTRPYYANIHSIQQIRTEQAMFHFGTNRVGIELGSFIVKLPRPNIGLFIHHIRCAYFMKSKRDVQFFFRFILKSRFKGIQKAICDSRAEYWHSKNLTGYTPPCLYYLLGMSIHKKATPLGMSKDAFYDLTRQLFPGDSAHTIQFPENFGIYEGKIVCLDYADSPLEDIVHYVTTLREHSAEVVGVNSRTSP